MLRPRSGPRPRRDGAGLDSEEGVKRLRRDPRRKGVGGRGLRPVTRIKLVIVVRQTPNLCPAASDHWVGSAARSLRRREALLSTCSHRMLDLCSGAEGPEPERSSGPDTPRRGTATVRGEKQGDRAGRTAAP